MLRYDLLQEAIRFGMMPTKDRADGKGVSMTNTSKPGLLLVLAAAMILFIPGCQEKVTRENYEQVREGMTISQVEAILGKGEVQTSVAGEVSGVGGSVAVYKWTKDDKVITVTFVNNAVTAKIATGL
jgi:hypothetical protein